MASTTDRGAHGRGERSREPPPGPTSVGAPWAPQNGLLPPTQCEEPTRVFRLVATAPARELPPVRLQGRAFLCSVTGRLAHVDLLAAHKECRATWSARGAVYDSSEGRVARRLSPSTVVLRCARGLLIHSLCILAMDLDSADIGWDVERAIAEEEGLGGDLRTGSPTQPY